MATYYRPWDPAQVNNWNQRGTSPPQDCSVGEWGLDVGLNPPTSIYAPFAGTVSYQPCGCASTNCQLCWYPGVVFLQGGPFGESLGFGHVHAQADGAVAAGQLIAVAAADGYPSPHVEFMHMPSGHLACSAAIDPRPYLTTLLNQGLIPGQDPTPPPPDPGPMPGPAPAPAPPSSVVPALLLLAGAGGLLWYGAKQRGYRVQVAARGGDFGEEEVYVSHRSTPPQASAGRVPSSLPGGFGG